MRLSEQSFGKEHQMTLELADFLNSGEYRVRLEVPNLGQSADVVATRGRWVTMMEVKVHDWRRAIEQCRAHEHVADFVCIVVGTKRISSKAKSEIERRGYGLIHYQNEGRFEWILNPERNKSIWQPQRRKFSLALRKIDYVS